MGFMRRGGDSVFPCSKGVLHGFTQGSEFGDWGLGASFGFRGLGV